MWPFKRKPPPAPLRDCRDWNDDWKVGDTAEVIPGEWCETVPPWERLPTGARYTVVGFCEAVDDGARYYFLRLAELELSYTTQCFRKVRPVAAEKSEIVERILKAKPGKDRVREGAPTDSSIALLNGERVREGVV
jgi:hypothetical protein